MVCVTDCSYCVHRRDEKKNGWISTCDAFPNGKPLNLDYSKKLVKIISVITILALSLKMVWRIWRLQNARKTVIKISVYFFIIHSYQDSKRKRYITVFAYSNTFNDHKKDRDCKIITHNNEHDTSWRGLMFVIPCFGKLREVFNNYHEKSVCPFKLYLKRQTCCFWELFFYSLSFLKSALISLDRELYPY